MPRRFESSVATKILKFIQKNLRATLGTLDLLARAGLSDWAKLPTCLPTDVVERLSACNTPTPNTFDLYTEPFRFRIAEFHGTQSTKAITHKVTTEIKYPFHTARCSKKPRKCGFFINQRCF